MERRKVGGASTASPTSNKSTTTNSNRIDPNSKSSSINPRAMDETSADQTKPRRPVVLPALPKWELIVYFVIWVGHVLYGCYTAWRTSWEQEDRLYDGFFRPGWRLLNYRRKDAANYEWNSWTKSLPEELIGFVIGAVALKIVDRWYAGANRRRSDAVLTAVWTLILWIKLGWIGVATTFGHGAIMLAVARLTRWKLAVWATACGLLATLATQWYPFGVVENREETSYRFAVYIAYKLLHFISFCVYDIDAGRGKIEEEDEGGEKEILLREPPLQAYYSMLRYTLYPPYSATLIVNYPDYLVQWSKRGSSTTPKASPGRLVFIAVRLVFWTIINDLVLHFVYSNAMMSDPYFLARVDLFTLCAIGYTAGQYFHMKYVSIFGLNTFWALVDGMTPPHWPPICISRVALYSNMWRSFDRGLYAFLKDHLFLPLAAPTYSIWRRTFASFVSFAFVWLWHGLSWGFLYWVSMNFIEITMENAAKEIYRLPKVYAFVNARFSPAMIRRGRALMHIICASWGVFSIFYFLGGEDVGNVFMQRLVIGEGLRLNPPLLYLIGLGYFFSQCSMEMEAFMGRD